MHVKTFSPKLKPIHFNQQGANSHGQLGQSINNEQIEIPTIIADLLNTIKGVSDIACGGGHTLLLDEDGKLFSCGWNHMKQLCIENECNQFERVWPLSGIKFTEVRCGWDFSCAVSDDYFLFVWGSNSHGQLGLPRDHFSRFVKPIRLHVKASTVSMGLRHTAIINSKGEVWITGCGRHGQLGLGEETKSLDRFMQIKKVGHVSHLACGQNHTIAWSTEEKALYVWGDNKHGQLLLSNDKYRKIFEPQKIDIDVRQEVKKLLSGWTNALMWLDDGKLIAWGRNNYGQLGCKERTGNKVYISLPGGRQVKDVALGSEHTVCLATDNTLWAWGWNEHSNTGLQASDSIYEPTPVPIQLGNSIMTNIFSGSGHNFLVTKINNNTGDDCK